MDDTGPSSILHRCHDCQSRFRSSAEMKQTWYLLFVTAFVLLAALDLALSEPIKSHHHHHGHHHRKEHHKHHKHHHGGVYGFDDPFESNGRWLQGEDPMCNCEVIAMKLKKLREKVLVVIGSFDKLLTAQVDLRQIKNKLRNIELSLTTLGGFLANSESQLAMLEDYTTAISKGLSEAKAIAVQKISKEYLIDALGPLKSQPDLPPLEELDETVYSSCQDRRIVKTGVYKVSTNLTESTYVLCSLDFGQNAWTVIQNRFNGYENFFRRWSDYQRGFGYFGYGEYWLGLENIYQMTLGRECELLILLEDFDGKFVYAKYKYFRIEGEKDNYKISKLHGYVGTAGNSLQSSDGMAFSTYDMDNDRSDELNCAKENHGGWWYKDCGDSNLNGAYRKEYSHDRMGLYWEEFRGYYYSLKRTRVMIRFRKDHHHHHHHKTPHYHHHSYHRNEGEESSSEDRSYEQEEYYTPYDGSGAADTDDTEPIDTDPDPPFTSFD
ncbi:hypothetical protein AND_002984 [Anopheles darlingi]|uniref:Fibrinogen C-terminal domain-containing protein n=1 Tax=Anopheles darlingi TaxID=43151 RepID=W5JPL5_ANODA|nr:hypothetical protein AND_002984 [Anopheles darlingi]